MFSTPCTSFQCLFSIEQKNKKRFHGVLRKIYRERGVYWLSAYRICMFKNVDSGGWAVRVFFSQWVFYPPWKKKNIKVPLKRIKCSRAKRGLLWFSQKKKDPGVWSADMDFVVCMSFALYFPYYTNPRIQLYARTVYSFRRWVVHFYSENRVKKQNDPKRSQSVCRLGLF